MVSSASPHLCKRLAGSQKQPAGDWGRLPVLDVRERLSVQRAFGGDLRQQRRSGLSGTRTCAGARCRTRPECRIARVSDSLRSPDRASRGNRSPACGPCSCTSFLRNGTRLRLRRPPRAPVPAAPWPSAPAPSHLRCSPHRRDISPCGTGTARRSNPRTGPGRKAPSQPPRGV